MPSSLSVPSTIHPDVLAFAQKYRAPPGLSQFQSPFGNGSPDATDARALSAMMREHGMTMQNALSTLAQIAQNGGLPITVNQPRAWSQIAEGMGPFGPVNDATARGYPEPLGLGFTNLPAGGTATLSVQAQKRFVASKLTLTASTAAGTQLANVFVTSITIGGRTYTNTGNTAIPLEVFRNVDAFSNFAGVGVEVAQSVSVTFQSNGTDAVTVSGALQGFTREP